MKDTERRVAAKAFAEYWKDKRRKSTILAIASS